MSLIVGGAGPDGVAIGADSATAVSLTLTFPAEKLVPVPGRPLVIGLVGDVAATQHAASAILGAPELPDALNPLRLEVGDRIGRAVPARLGKVSCLLGGVVGGRPSLVEFDNAGRDVDYDRLGGLAAIGVDLIPLVIGAPFRFGARDLRHNSLLAYRLVADTTDLSLYVRPPIVMYRVALTDAAPHRLTPDELATLEQRVAAWRATEAAVFETITAGVEAVTAADSAAVIGDGRM
jgi:hypothetical protein